MRVSRVLRVDEHNLRWLVGYRYHLRKYPLAIPKLLLRENDFEPNYKLLKLRCQSNIVEECGWEEFIKIEADSHYDGLYHDDFDPKQCFE